VDAGPAFREKGREKRESTITEESARKALTNRARLDRDFKGKREKKEFNAHEGGGEERGNVSSKNRLYTGAEKRRKIKTKSGPSGGEGRRHRPP